jgi:hypothetical protein
MAQISVLGVTWIDRELLAKDPPSAAARRISDFGGHP